MIVKRFSRVDRIFHLSLMLTFVIQTITGFSRLYITTSWGRGLSSIFGGYENSLAVHQFVGILMIIGFLLHVVYLLAKVDWRHPGRSIFGPDSLVPNLHDLKHFGQRVLWFFGKAPPPKLERWSYWEKFDYWAVFWGLPLLAVTGLMLIYPLTTTRVLPGWTLNLAAFLHRAEAILAVSYIFIIHFYIGHLRPSSFPMNEAMFVGGVDIEEAMEEKPAWVERLRKEDRLEQARAPSRLYRVVYFVFGYAVVIFCFYMLINGIIFAPYVGVHLH